MKWKDYMGCFWRGKLLIGIKTRLAVYIFPCHYCSCLSRGYLNNAEVSTKLDVFIITMMHITPSISLSSFLFLLKSVSFTSSLFNSISLMVKKNSLLPFLPYLISPVNLRKQPMS